MANLQNPFDDETFQDISTTRNSGEGATSAGHAMTGGPHQSQTDPTFIGQNGHQRSSGLLTSLRTAAPAKGTPAQQGKQPRFLPIIMGTVGVLFIISCLGIGAAITINLLSFQGSLNGPQTTINDFYSALHTSNYHSAYNQLSLRYQQALDYNAFQAKYSALDALHGPIQSHQISNIQTQSKSAIATVKLVRSVQTKTAETEIQTVQLIVENSSWKIDNIVLGQSSTS